MRHNDCRLKKTALSFLFLSPFLPLLEPTVGCGRLFSWGAPFVPQQSPVSWVPWMLEVAQQVVRQSGGSMVGNDRLNVPAIDTFSNLGEGGGGAAQKAHQKLTGRLLNYTRALTLRVGADGAEGMCVFWCSGARGEPRSPQITHRMGCWEGYRWLSLPSGGKPCKRLRVGTEPQLSYSLDPREPPPEMLIPSIHPSNPSTPLPFGAIFGKTGL